MVDGQHLLPIQTLSPACGDPVGQTCSLQRNKFQNVTWIQIRKASSPVSLFTYFANPHWVADAAGCLVVAEVIFADPTVLSTLSRREVVEGLAEAIKMGVIRDAQLFEDGPGPGKSGKWALKIPSGELAFWLKTIENICCPGATEQILRGMEHYLIPSSILNAPPY